MTTKGVSNLKTCLSQREWREWVSDRGKEMQVGELGRNGLGLEIWETKRQMDDGEQEVVRRTTEILGFA